MAKIPESNYPGGSKSRVTRAGSAVRDETFTAEDLAVIDIWRAAHRPVLNTFQAILRTRAKGKGIVVAQRHKRKRTIFDKLDRFPKMELARMDDVAGCRLIFKDIVSLTSFRNNIHKAKYNHKRRNEVDKYDYLKKPKNTGYRGIHDIYEYDVNSEHGKEYKGLFIELQYRTLAQHAWATTVEIIGFITASQPKFQQGDKRYEHVMVLASEIIARHAEGMNSCLPSLPATELVEQFLYLDSELNFLSLLKGLNVANKSVSNKKNVILIFSGSDQLEIKEFRDATDALRELFLLEKNNPGKDVVLVKADTSDEVRVAFKNYFSDATEFIKLIEDGCEKLSGRRIIREKTADRTRPRKNKAAHGGHH